LSTAISPPALLALLIAPYVPVASIAGAILARLRSKVPAGRAIVKASDVPMGAAHGGQCRQRRKPSR
jgi:hypothetical protein